MKRLVMTLVAAVMTLVASAQQSPLVLGKSHAMQRVGVTNKYLLLPVQEREDNATIKVLVNGQQVQKLNIRLAVDKVDYYVPLDVKRFGAGEILLDIFFHGDRRFTGAMKDFLCWKEMKFSDTFDTANREKFRPQYHHTPVYGWMNDPNGMFYKDGVYHLYYQWNPYGSMWENMTWGHSTSKDLIHWEAQPTAIEPDALGDIFSGSCVVDKKNNRVVAFYTSAGERSQVQSMAVSKDGGLTFQKYAGNPVLVSQEGDFRDPKCFWNPEIQKWNLILAVGQEMRIYSSTNLTDWKYESSFGSTVGCHDGVWECPDLIKLQVRGTDKQKWMLICNINPGGPYGGSATQYFIGDFDGRHFNCEHKDTRWMDYGKDHYATVTWSNAPEGRTVAIAWMSNWQYANSVPTRQFRSSNSVPRDLSLVKKGKEVILKSTPSKEVEALRGNPVQFGLSTAPVELFDNARKAYELVIRFTLSKKDGATFVLSNESGEQVVLSYDAAVQTFSMDRRGSGNVKFSKSFAAVTTAPTRVGGKMELRLLVDSASIEAFGEDFSMTNLVFPSSPYNTIKMYGNTKADVTLYPLSK